jgi:hypothetical protein
MGTGAAPTYANIYVTEIDIMVQKCAAVKGINAIFYYKKFIDDIFIIFKCSMD